MKKQQNKSTLKTMSKNKKEVLGQKHNIEEEVIIEFVEKIFEEIGLLMDEGTEVFSWIIYKRDGKLNQCYTENLAGQNKTLLEIKDLKLREPLVIDVRNIISAMAEENDFEVQNEMSKFIAQVTKHFNSGD